MHVKDLCCSSVYAKHIKIFKLADKTIPYVTDYVTVAKLATLYTEGVYVVNYMFNGQSTKTLVPGFLMITYGHINTEYTRISKQNFDVNYTLIKEGNN